MQNIASERDNVGYIQIWIYLNIGTKNNGTEAKSGKGVDNN